MKKFFYLLLTLGIVFPFCCFADDKNNLERKWTTDNGDTVRCLYLSMDGDNVGSIDIDWGDGTVESALVTSEGQVTIICHEYTSQQNYSVTMEGTTTGDDFNYVGFVDQHVTEITAGKSDTLDYFVVEETSNQLSNSTYENMISKISGNHGTVENIIPKSNDSNSTSPGGGGGGGGGGSTPLKTNSGTKVDTGIIVNTGNKVEEKIEEDKVQESEKDNLWYQEGNQQEVLSNGYTREFNNAYTFAYKNGITTMDSIDKADMNGGLNRIAMAKMLSNYAINVLGKKPANKVVPNFPDVPNELNENYGGAVDLAYQLGIMGIGIENFRPYDEVNRKEFGTALSRMLFGLADGIDNYYSTHLEKLKKEGIISNDNPDLKELRGYVMLMLMRSAQ